MESAARDGAGQPAIAGKAFDVTCDDAGVGRADNVAALRAEIDRVRLEAHHLAVELDRGDWRTRTRDVITARGDRLKRGYRSARARLGQALGRPGGAGEAAHFHQSFRPYEVRPLRELENGRAKVLHFIANFYTGGSPRLIVDLVEQLGHRFDHRVITRDLPPTAAYTGLDIRLDQRFSPGLVKRRLKSWRPDLIHVHYIAHRNDEWALADWRWYRVIFDGLRDYGAPVVENVNIPVVPFFDTSVCCYVHVSDYVRRAYGHSGDHNITIHPGSDLSFFSRAPEASFDDDTIGMVYRLDGDKVNERAIDVFLDVVARRPGTRALIVGGGYLLEAYRARAERAGLSHAFTFTGYVSYYDLPAYLQRMSVFIAPVHTESFGQVGPFAMGMQLPVAAYDVGALGEITGAAELLAPPGDHVRLADIVIDLLGDREKRLRIGVANRERAVRMFSVEAMAASYDQLYGSLRQEERC
jgi:glycosyltransferase involved in cell wall biosynthesis